MSEPKSLNFSALKKPKPTLCTSAKDETVAPEQLWPSRSIEKSPTPKKKPEMENLTVRMEVGQANKFRQLCEEERRTYGGMLDVLMGNYEKL